VLFEIATDDPGFLIDEAEPALGQTLRLPPQYEADRTAIESALPALALPAAARPAPLG
jgi:glyoxalase family protein